MVDMFRVSASLYFKEAFNVTFSNAAYRITAYFNNVQYRKRNRAFTSNEKVVKVRWTRITSNKDVSALKNSI